MRKQEERRSKGREDTLEATGSKQKKEGKKGGMLKKVRLQEKVMTEVEKHEIRKEAREEGNRKEKE